MANGRFLSKTIAVSAQLARVSDQAELLFYRMLAHADRDGRLEGDPLLIKATCAPLKASLTLEGIPHLLWELSQTVDADGEPLVRWYEVRGRRVLQFPGFDRHQQGMRKEREAASRLPSFESDATPLKPPEPTPPTTSGKAPQARRSGSGAGPAVVRSRTGSDREERPPKLSEVQGKLREVQGDTPSDVQDQKQLAADAAGAPGNWVTECAQVYAEHIGVLPHGRIGAALKPLLAGYPLDRLREMWVAFCEFGPHLDARGQVQPEINAPQFCTPERFAQSAKFWLDYTTPLTSTVRA